MAEERGASGSGLGVLDEEERRIAAVLRGNVTPSSQLPGECLGATYRKYLTEIVIRLCMHWHTCFPAEEDEEGDHEEGDEEGDEEGEAEGDDDVVDMESAGGGRAGAGVVGTDNDVCV